MSKAIKSVVRLMVPAGQAKPAPPVGPALGQAGLNIMSFCKDFNAKTADIKVRNSCVSRMLPAVPLAHAIACTAEQQRSRPSHASEAPRVQPGTKMRVHLKAYVDKSYEYVRCLMPLLQHIRACTLSAKLHRCYREQCIHPGFMAFFGCCLAVGA